MDENSFSILKRRKQIPKKYEHQELFTLNEIFEILLLWETNSEELNIEFGKTLECIKNNKYSMTTSQINKISMLATELKEINVALHKIRSYVSDKLITTIAIETSKEIIKLPNHFNKKINPVIVQLLEEMKIEVENELKKIISEEGIDIENPTDTQTEQPN